MLALYLSLVPLSVGGVAVFLKSQNPWLKWTGLAVFGLALFALLLLPAFLNQQSN